MISRGSLRQHKKILAHIKNAAASALPWATKAKTSPISPHIQFRPRSLACSDLEAYPSSNLRNILQRSCLTVLSTFYNFSFVRPAERWYEPTKSSAEFSPHFDGETLSKFCVHFVTFLSKPVFSISYFSDTVSRIWGRTSRNCVVYPNQLL
jgi:hypothetical protein